MSDAHSIKQALSWACEQFSQSDQLDSDSPKLDAELLLGHVLDKNRTYLFTWPERELDAQQWSAFQAAVERRSGGEPVAHILELREFWSLPLKVSPHTLIPRPDTEVLVEAALSRVSKPAPKIVDLGTGTGAIALALASELPDAQIWATELNSDAVTLARENALRLDLEVTVVEGSWLKPLSGQDFDLIVSNPPYIDMADPHLEQGDVRFEPHSALVAAERGLADIRIIINQAWPQLHSGGWLMFEHGYQQGAEVRQLMQAKGFVQCETLQDYGGNDRVTLGLKPDI